MKVAAIIKAIGEHIKKYVDEKFTGTVVFRLRFIQGGVREAKLTIEKNL